jgi:hypothetical protein
MNGIILLINWCTTLHGNGGVSNDELGALGRRSRTSASSTSASTTALER